MLGKLEAILKAPPCGSGASRVFSTTVGAAASGPAVITTATTTDGAYIPLPFGCFITWISDTDCYVRVGADASMGNATSADWFLPAGVEKEWWHFGQTQSFFSVIQKTAGGTIKRYRSSI